MSPPGGPGLVPGRPFLVLAAADAAALVLLARVVVVPALGAAGADRALREGLPLAVAAAQAVFLLAVAPGLARGGRGWIQLGLLGLSGAVGLGVADPAGLRVPLVDAGILLGFGAVLLGLRDSLRGLGAGEAAARLAPVLLGAALLTTLTWSGPFAELLSSPSAGVDAAVRVNPLACIGAAHGLDWARARPVTYDQFVGQYYPYSYPSPRTALLGWAAAGGALGCLGAWLARRRVEVPDGGTMR